MSILCLNKPVVVVASPECCQVSIVGWRRVRDRPFTPRVQVAKVETQLLNLIRGEFVVVKQQVVAGGPGGTLIDIKGLKIE